MFDLLPAAGSPPALQVDPIHRAQYHKSDAESWRYSYPLAENHVPAWAVPCIAMLTPLLVIAVLLAAGRISRLEAHMAGLMAVSCVATTGVVTNFIKVNVGRPRPHFVERCWPGGVTPAFTSTGRPLCAPDATDPVEGLKSFPSGHTSWSTSGLGYTTLFLLGKMRCFDGAARPLRFLGCLCPLLGAVWIGERGVCAAAALLQAPAADLARARWCL